MKHKETRYHIELAHESGTFEQDMDFLSPSPNKAYEHLLMVENKYKRHKIKITQITTIETRRTISKKALEDLASKPL